jgi:hypothetical protein
MSAWTDGQLWFVFTLLITGALMAADLAWQHHTRHRRHRQ